MTDAPVEIYVQVHDGTGDIGATFLERLSDRVGELGDAVLQVSQSLTSQVEQVLTQPHDNVQVDEVDVGLGLSLEAQGKVIIGHIKGGATLDIILKYRRA